MSEEDGVHDIVDIEHGASYDFRMDGQMVTPGPWILRDIKRAGKDKEHLVLGFELKATLLKSVISPGGDD